MKDEIRKLDEVIESIRREIVSRGEVRSWDGRRLIRIEQNLLQARDRLKYYNQ